MKKKSFFEKLTGIVTVDNETDDQDSDDSVETEIEEAEEETEGQLAIDMYQTPSEIVVKTMIAGVKQEDLERFLSIEPRTHWLVILDWPQGTLELPASLGRRLLRLRPILDI